MSIFDQVKNEILCEYYKNAYKYYLKMQKKHISGEYDKEFKKYARKALKYLERWTELLRKM